MVLGVNDWILKGSEAPEWLTGKLSDFAGLFAFPVVATAAFDLVLFAAARLGLLTDFTLRRWKLASIIGLTAVVFAAMKLSPAVADWMAAASSAVVGRSSVMADPTDLVALVVLAGTWWHGRRVIARGAYGRVEIARRRHAVGRPLSAPFADAVRCGADPAVVGALDDAIAAWLGGGPPAPVDAALERLRATGSMSAA